MNRIFGFFKQRLKQAKEQNQSQLQNIINAIEFQAYSQAKMLNYLQQIKTNYLEWNIMIANQASTGLYYTQLHHKTTLVKKVKSEKESKQRQERLGIVLTQMKKTLHELKSIEKLNAQWTNSMNSRVQQLEQALKEQEKTTQEQRPQIQQQQQQQEQVVNEKVQEQAPLKPSVDEVPPQQQPQIEVPETTGPVPSIPQTQT